MSTDANSTITYYVPQNNRKKTVLRVPECHNLHICPSSCGRRHAIRALKNGEKHLVSFLYISEDDAISGSYEKNISEAISELLSVLDPKPKVFLLYFNCIDDFLGTDENALLLSLSERFPSLCFGASHINPVAVDEKTTPGMQIHNQLYTFLKPSPNRDNGINFIGHYSSIDQNCELYSVLSDWGIYPIRQLFDLKSFTEYQQMANSRLNLILMPMGKLAAHNMTEKLNIPSFFNPVSYSIDEVLQNYRSLAELLGKPCPDFSREIDQTRRTIQETLKVAGDTAVIAGSGTMRPFALAKAMIQYGFRVVAVFAHPLKDDDANERDWLFKHFPKIPVIEKTGHKAITGYGIDGECIALGHDSSFLLQAKYPVEMFSDESFYGFYGIRKLMNLICKAFEMPNQL